MEGTEYQGDDFEETTGTEVASQQNSRPVDTRPEYVDFDVNDFPGGLPACLEAMLMAADQPQHSADLARVLSTALAFGEHQGAEACEREGHAKHDEGDGFLTVAQREEEGHQQRGRDSGQPSDRCRGPRSGGT